jgi:hypothetical protein
MVVDQGKSLSRGRAVAFRQSNERRPDVRAQTKPTADTVEMNDLGTHEERGQELRALQRLSVIRQDPEPTVHMAFPIFRRSQSRLRCEAALIAQGQG